MGPAGVQGGVGVGAEGIATTGSGLLCGLVGSVPRVDGCGVRGCVSESE